jgi:acetyl-CoA carboxylase biotin carboxyl carrier protein
MMDFDELKRILEMVREHELTEFELERDHFKIRIRKNASGQLTASLPVLPPVAYAPPVPPPVPGHQSAAAPAGLPATDEEIDLAVLKSPIVGTFYRAPEPGAPPFTEVGARVKKGQVLCIIEAMKLMNEINSDVDGEVVKVYVEDRQPVQYGERLFAIKPLNV